MDDKATSLSKKWENESVALNELIVSGQLDTCRERLDMMTPKSIPRHFAATLAQLASRVEYPLFALKILHSYIYPEKEFDTPATSKEKLVYCHALIILGAHDEAHEILDTIDPKENSDVLFHKAMAYVSQWNYKKSIPLLKDYLKSSKLEPYRKIIAEVNLAAAYGSVNSWKLALGLLGKIQKTCAESNYQLLLGNSYELEAQVYFFQKNYDQAIACLKKGREILKGQPGIYSFYVEKWMGFCTAFKTGNADVFQTLRQQGLENNYFETVRECDLFEGLLKKDEQLIRKVIMGTPSEFYRERVRNLFHRTIRPQGAYALQLGSEQRTKNIIFDPQEKVGPEKAMLAETPKLFSLYEALTTDFYKPSYLGYLFKQIYTDEKFNPMTSPARVLGLLNRLDEWFKAADLPLEVYFKKSEFRLRSKASLQIIIRRGKKLTLQDARWSEIKNEIGHRPFSALEVSKLLKISKATSLRMLQQAIAAKRIQTVGHGGHVMYQFIKK